MVQSEALLRVVREKGELEYCVKKSEVLTMKSCCICPGGFTPCLHINGYKAALAFREQPVCVCGLSAHPSMTLRKKRWKVEVMGKSPLGYTVPCCVWHKTPLS